MTSGLVRTVTATLDRCRRRSPGSGACLLLVGLAACSSDPAVPPPALDIIIGSGDGQFGVVSTLLPSPLRVVVLSEATGLPKRGVGVLWDVTGGDATLVGAATASTDSAGAAEIRVRLGSGAEQVGVRARLAGQPSVSVTFEAFGVAQPRISAITPASVNAGGTITLTGNNFSPVPDQDVVLISGIRGRVVSATSTSIEAIVPTCVPARDVRVHMQLGSVASADTMDLIVTGGTVVSQLAVGDVIDVSDDGGFECHALPGPATYLTIVYSASTIGAAKHPFRLSALSSSGALAAPARAGPVTEPSDSLPEEQDLQTAWDAHVRELEAGLIRSRASRSLPPTGPSRSAPVAAPPMVGERRTFHVLNAHGSFDDVGAAARWVGSRAAIFVDTLAPAPPDGFTDAELGAFAARFDDVIYPIDTETFGAVSDLDANGRVVILFTTAVNRLTPRGSSGFVGGFFYGLDLLPGNTGSNAAEVFYTLVPDPAGIFSGPRPKAQLLKFVPAILAHEFQHMIHFNERVLLRGATSQEALWLSEALAQMAEELLARSYDGADAYAADTLFRGGARTRSRLYLQRPDTVSVITTTGWGSLVERGADFLQLLYVDDQVGGDLLTRLTRTTRTGVANLEAESGLSWPDLLADWWSAVYLDLPSGGTGSTTYPTIDLRKFLGTPYPLNPTPIGSLSLTASGALWSSSATYYVVTPTFAGSTTLRLAGEGGGPSAPQAALRVRIIRLS
jgi:hypothetical protein